MVKTKKSFGHCKKRYNKCSKSIASHATVHKTKKKLRKYKIKTTKKKRNNLNKYKIYKGGSVLLGILKMEQMDSSLKYIKENEILLKTLEKNNFSRLVGILIRELIIKTNNNINQVDSMILKILTLLYNQTKTDPPYYVSHSLDHSIRVTVKMFELLKNIPELNTYMKEKYRKANINLLILFAGLLHDVGYSDLVYCLNGDMKEIHTGICGENKGIPPKKKFLHSVSSKLMTEQIFDLKILFDEITIQDLLDSIKEHNFDVNECKTNPEPGSCNFKPTEQAHSFYIKPAERDDGVIHREYIEADIKVKPLLFALRIADNLDFEYSRLTNVQQDENLMLVQKSIFMNSEITDAQDPKKEGVLKNEIERLGSSVPLDKYNMDEKEIMTIIINSLKKNEFLFNYSNWIVEKAELIKNEEGMRMRVKFRDVENDELNAKNKSNYESSVYQITRCAESFSSLKFHSNILTDLITVELIYADGTIEIKKLKDFILA